MTIVRRFRVIVLVLTVFIAPVGQFGSDQSILKATISVKQFINVVLLVYSWWSRFGKLLYGRLNVPIMQ